MREESVSYLICQGSEEYSEPFLSSGKEFCYASESENKKTNHVVGAYRVIRCAYADHTVPDIPGSTLSHV
jgi:hypothetical protein